MFRIHTEVFLYLSMFWMSVHTSQHSWGKSTGEDDLSSSIGTSELSSTLQSVLDSGQSSFPVQF